MTYLKNLVLKCLENENISDWYETEHDADIVSKVENATPSEVRTTGLDSIGDICSSILDSGLEEGIITNEDIENAE